MGTDRTDDDRVELLRAAAGFLRAHLTGDMDAPLAPAVAANGSLLVDGLIFLSQGIAKTLADARGTTTGQVLASIPRNDITVISGYGLDWSAAADLVVGIEDQDSSQNPIVRDASERLGILPTAVNSAASVAMATLAAFANETSRDILEILDALARAAPPGAETP